MPRCPSDVTDGAALLRKTPDLPELVIGGPSLVDKHRANRVRSGHYYSA